MELGPDGNVHPPKALDMEEKVTGSPDKIVIFAAWPSSNEQILDVLSVYGIRNVVTVNGKMSPKARKAAVDQFKMPDGPRIMILSGVGTTGLNLQIAHILIIVVSLLNFVLNQTQ